MIVKRKEQSIETIRGIAIILMVAGHVIGRKTTTGLCVSDDSTWKYIYYSFEYLRMPLFTAISGFVYALKPVNNEYILKFIKGKSRRLLIPFITVATIQYCFNAFIPNVNNPVEMSNIWTIYIYSFSQFWFLMALFQVFMVIVILEYYGVTKKIRGWLISFILATFLLYIINQKGIVINIFQFTHFMYLFPFFLLGLGINRFSSILFSKKVLPVISTILIFGLILQQLSWFRVIDLEMGKVGFLGILVGITGIWIIFYLRKPNKYLAWLGYYSYGIYLFHVFGTGGSRIIAKALGIESNIILFCISLTFGLGIPILIELVILKSKILRLLFLGLR